MNISWLLTILALVFSISSWSHNNHDENKNTLDSYSQADNDENSQDNINLADGSNERAQELARYFMVWFAYIVCGNCFDY